MEGIESVPRAHLAVGEGVVDAPVGAQKFGKGVFFGVELRPEEQHVFAKVCLGSTNKS